MRTPHLAHFPEVFDTHTLSCSEYCSDPHFNCKIDLANWSPLLRLVFKTAKSIISNFDGLNTRYWLLKTFQVTLFLLVNSVMTIGKNFLTLECMAIHRVFKNAINHFAWSFKKTFSEHPIITSDLTHFGSIDAAKKRCLELNDCSGFVEDQNGNFFLRKDKNCLFDSAKYTRTFIRPRPCSTNSQNTGFGSKEYCNTPTVSCIHSLLGVRN